MPSPEFYGISFMGLYGVVILEVYLLNRWRGQAMDWREVVVNMNSGQAVLWLFHGARVWAYAQIHDRLSLGLLDGLPPLLLYPAAFLMWDLAFYLSHRAHHRFPLLWEIHAVHHQGEAFNVSLAVRNGWLQVVTPTPFFAVLAIIGVPVEVFLTIGAIHYTIQLYNHNGLTLRPSPLDRVVVTPRHHRVHHAKDREYHDRNFGSALVIWDRLFGTFAEERSDRRLEVGLGEGRLSENTLWLNLEPLTRRLGLGGAERRGRAFEVGAPWLVLGSLILFGLFCLHIVVAPGWSPVQGAALLGFVVGGTVLLGAAADGERWALAAWALLASVGASAALSTGAAGPWVGALLAAGAAHGLAGLRALRRG